MDWATIEERLILKKTCTVCKMKGDKSKFTRSELRKTQATPVCLACMESIKGELDEWTHHFCETYQSMKPDEKFTMRIGERQVFRKRNCTNCSPCSSQQRGGLREVTKAKTEKNKSTKAQLQRLRSALHFQSEWTHYRAHAQASFCKEKPSGLL